MSATRKILVGIGIMAILGIWSLTGLTPAKTWIIGIIGGLDVVLTIAAVFLPSKS